MEGVKRNLSKIIKAKSLNIYQLYTPEILPNEDETFRALFQSEAPEEIERSLLEENLIEEVASRQEEAKESFEREMEALRELAREEGYRAGFDEGYRNGFDKGYEEGKLKAQGELEIKIREIEENLNRQYEIQKAQELERFRNLITKTEEELEGLILDLDKEIVAVVKALLQKIVLREMREDEDLLLRIVREALNYIVDGTEIVIRINPEDMNLLEKLSFTYFQGKKIRFVPNESISRGGLFIETSFGVIDATFEKRMENLLNLLEDKKAS